MITFRIKGLVKEKESGIPLSGIFVKAYDKDLIFDDLLGAAVSDSNGKFEVVCESEDFQEFFDAKPDIYFKAYRADRQTLLHTTEDAIHWGMGKDSEFEILIPFASLHGQEQTQIILQSDDGTPRELFEAGESLVFQARGLRPAHAYEIEISMAGKELFISRLLSNRRGEIEETVLWPQIGFDDPNSNARYTPDEAQQRWANKTLTLTLASAGKRIAQQNIRLAPALTRPLVMATERDGRLLNGFEVGTQPLYLTLRNLPASGEARIFMTPRQHDWRVGDPIVAATLSNGRPAVRDVRLPQAGGQAVIEFAAADALLPGAYDFIVRPLRYGYEQNDVPRLLATDIVCSRRITGAVIREKFWTAKPVLGGCVNKLPVSGRTVSGAPYFRYSDTFEVGEDVWAALDPGIVDPNNISKMCALYVIQSKDDATWGTDNSLAHLPVLGGNAAVQKLKVQAGCINVNRVLVWPAAMQPGEYDIVADFGNNTPDASSFVTDASYDTPLDIIDGYFVAGFRVVEDPGTMADFAHAGNWNYDEAVVAGMGLSGTVVVDDENGSYHNPGGFSVISSSVPMRAHAYFPADSAGVTDPAQISAAQANYPLVVVIHGNGHSYTSYDFLLEHFAKNGFIAASIHLNGGMSGLGRANVFFHHMTVLQAAFGAKLQNNIGIMGHSRGGEAVLKVVRLNQEGGLGYNINAVVSLAPTDQYGSEVLGDASSAPYLVIYGSRDCDVAGWTPYAGYTVPQTGFSLYDRAHGDKKSMVFVYRATHNGFITANDNAAWASENPLDFLDPDPQKKITKAYMNAFLRQHLRGEAKWEGMFTGEWKPAEVAASGVRLFIQSQEASALTVDDFEGVVPNWQLSTIGGVVSHGATLPADPDEGVLSPTLDTKSPHDTKGMKLRWNNLGDRLVFDLPALDVTAFSTLSFRISQKVDSASNPANQPQNLRVALKDGTGNERAVRVSPFAEIPFPDYRPIHTLSKSAMNTVRIPLKSYTIVCAGQTQVNLADLVSLTFLFSETATGEIDIDQIEFTN